MNRRTILFWLLLAPAPLCALTPDSTSILFTDAIVPGFGSFYTGRPVAGSMIAGTRVGTAYLAWYFKQREKEYRSAENAARIAEFYFGPGYRFKNPYGSGYYSASEFHRMAGRREFYSHLAILFHAGITVASLFATESFLSLDAEQNGPVFPEPRVRVSLSVPF